METRNRGPLPTSAPPPYWNYMFESDKTPTKQLHMLLTSIAKYITENLGDRRDKKLTPSKLAAFYNAVGGNYDALFVDVPHHSISYVFQRIGCQHTLQPTIDDFEAPSIPALTVRGFIRWESIETLLQPEEHVPYIQYAVKHFGLKDPETGELYPTDLPLDVFPLVPDAAMVRWHNDCAQRLKRIATPDILDDPNSDREHSGARPDLPPRPDIRHGYSHVRPQFAAGRASREGNSTADYFNSRPLHYSHVPRGFTSGNAADGLRPGIGRSFTTKRANLAPEDDRGRFSRRRSVPDNYQPPNSSPLNSPPKQPEGRAEATGREQRPDRAQQHRPRGRSTSSSLSSPTDEAASSRSASPPRSPRMRKGPPHSQADLKNLRHQKGMQPPPPRDATRNTPPSPFRSRGFTVGDQPVPLVKPDPRLPSYSIPPNMRSKASAPFGPPLADDNLSRSNSRGSANGNGVRWKDDRARRPSDGVEVDDRGRDNMHREERPRIPHLRSGSHDGRYGIREDRKDKRYKEREWESNTDREERDRDGEKKKKSTKRRWW